MPEEHLQSIAREIAERTPRRQRILTVNELRVLDGLRQESGRLMQAVSRAMDEREKQLLSEQLKFSRRELRRAELHMTVPFHASEARLLFHLHFPEAVPHIEDRVKDLASRQMPFSLYEAEQLYNALVHYRQENGQGPVPETHLKDLINKHLPRWV